MEVCSLSVSAVGVSVRNLVGLPLLINSPVGLESDELTLLKLPILDSVKNLAYGICAVLPASFLVN